MVITITILAYVVNVFLSRWFNKKAVEINDGCSIPLIWFIPIIGVIAFFVVYITEVFKVDKRSNWFTGKNW